ADRQIVFSTISMVRNLGMQYIAEGIESPEELELLRKCHCDIAQGYYIAKPIPEDDILQAMEMHFIQGQWLSNPKQPIHKKPITQAL
ncbi:MAG: EAL domain-containing protein, partial [Chloroflexota bacterium]